MHDQKKRTSMPDEKRALLCELGVFGESAGELEFHAMLPKLLEFKGRYGHVIVPRGEVTEDGMPLGNWAFRMRQRMKRGNLPEHWRKALIEIGLPLDNKEAKFWLHFEAAEYCAA